MATDEQTRVKRRDEVSMTISGEEALLVDERTGSVHVVNQTAGRIWELCDGEPTLEQVAARLAEFYGIDSSEVRDDVEAMLVTFRDLGIVELIPA